MAAAAAVNALMRLNAARAHPDLVMDVGSLQTSLDDLQERSSFSDLRADITNLDANLNKSLGIPVTIGNPLRHVTQNVSGVSDEDLALMAPCLSVAIGLALPGED